MTISSVSQYAATNPAVLAISRLQDDIEATTYRLASGNRFHNAGDDAASLATSVKLQTQVTSLRQALLNSAQADSLLKVAYGGLDAISEILLQQKSLVTQAIAGGLTDNERAFLDVQFQDLSAQIDAIATTTSFNGIKLLDGSIANDQALVTPETNATQATGQLRLNANTGAGQTIILNGVTLTAGTSFTIGATTADTVTNLASALNSSTNSALNQASYSAGGNTLYIAAKAGGELGSLYRISRAGTANDTAIGSNTNIGTVKLLQGGVDDGLYLGGTTVSGTIGNTIINTVNQTPASSVFTLTAQPLANRRIRIDNGNGGLINFQFINGVPGNNTQIHIGADIEETLRNAVTVIENYTGTNDYVVRQLELSTSGNTITFRNRLPGNVLDLVGTNANIAENIPTATLSKTVFNNGVNTGVNVIGVVNPEFRDTVSGFGASYVSPDRVDLSITVGASTYTGTVTDTTPAANTFVRLNSTDGGYFDIQLRSGGGQTVANQTDADVYAGLLDNAFSGLTFSQTRPVTSFDGYSTLGSAVAGITATNFDKLRVQRVEVTPAADLNSDALIEVTVSGEKFSSAAGIGYTLGSRETIQLTSQDGSGRSLNIRIGSQNVDLSTTNGADTFETDLYKSFGLNPGSGTIDFVVGENSADTLKVIINGAGTGRLFNNTTPNVGTLVSAQAASVTVDNAINLVQEIVTEVASKQSVLDYVGGNLATTIGHADSARSRLTDTDIASESARYAALLVQQQIGVSVTAQTQLLSTGLLDLIRAQLKSTLKDA